jgi:hypothetical protein
MHLELPGPEIGFALDGERRWRGEHQRQARCVTRIHTQLGFSSFVNSTTNQL